MLYLVIRGFTCPDVTWLMLDILAKSVVCAFQARFASSCSCCTAKDNFLLEQLVIAETPQGACLRTFWWQFSLFFCAAGYVKKFYLKVFPQSNSNPGQLDRKRKHCHCAKQSPYEYNHEFQHPEDARFTKMLDLWGRDTKNLLFNKLAWTGSIYLNPVDPAFPAELFGAFLLLINLCYRLEMMN